MIKLTKQEYLYTLQTFKEVVFTQSRAWLEYQISNNSEVVFYSSDCNNILCFGIVKRSFSKDIILKIEGPIVRKDASNKSLVSFLSQLRDLPYPVIIVDNSTAYFPEFEYAIRLSGFKRPFGQSQTTLTIYKNLSSFDYDRNWKRNINKAKDNNLVFSEIKSPSLSDAVQFVNLFNELVKIKKLLYQLKPQNIFTLVSDASCLFYAVYYNEQMIAARIVIKSYDTAYDVFAANGIEARDTGATFFLMDNIFKDLASKDTKYFDFSRIPVGKSSANGVTSFKVASKGEITQYNGEFVYSKYKWFRITYFTYSLLLLKKKFY